MTDVAKARAELEDAIEAAAHGPSPLHRAVGLAAVAERLDALIAEARAEERERCARVCDEAARGWREELTIDGLNEDYADRCNARASEADDLAARIRALSGKP